MLENKTIAVLGAGTMGHAILGDLVSHGQPRRRVVATTRTRDAAQRLAKEPGIRTGTDNVAAGTGADIVVLRVGSGLVGGVGQSSGKYP